MSIDRALRLTRQALSVAPSGLFSDVDGTLSPIVVNPDEARVSTGIKRALRALRLHVHTVAVVSGRRASDARRMVGVAGLTYVGNHGMELIQARASRVELAVQPYLADLGACATCLAERLDLEGVTLENKQVTASIHYRQARDPGAAREAILEAIRACSSCARLRVSDGRLVVNLAPPVAVNKGTAIMRIAERRRLAGLVYIGDDVTDLDAFAALRDLRALGRKTAAVAVISDEAPPELAASADATLSSVTEVEELLLALADLPTG